MYAHNLHARGHAHAHTYLERCVHDVERAEQEERPCVLVPQCWAWRRLCLGHRRQHVCRLRTRAPVLGISRYSYGLYSDGLYTYVRI